MKIQVDEAVLRQILETLEDSVFPRLSIRHSQAYDKAIESLEDLLANCQQSNIQVKNVTVVPKVVSEEELFAITSDAKEQYKKGWNAAISTAYDVIDAIELDEKSGKVKFSYAVLQLQIPPGFNPKTPTLDAIGKVMKE